jgi:hypothetical protein
MATRFTEGKTICQLVPGPRVVSNMPCAFEHWSQTNIVATVVDCPHNIHRKATCITALKMGQSSHPHWEDDMVHNYAHGPSMSNHLVPPTIIFQKVGPSKHAKSQDL